MSQKRAWGVAHAAENALAFGDQSQPSESLKPAHLAKRKLRNKSLEITFDPQEHREYVTGFHKRKLQRRKDAQRKLEEKAKKQRLEERAQKRADLKKRLDLDRYMTSSEEEPDDKNQEQKRPGDVRAFSSNGMRATVTVKPFSIHTDSEEEQEQEQEQEADTATASEPAAESIRKERPVHQEKHDTPRKPKLKGTFSSLTQKQTMHKKTPSDKGKAQKGSSRTKKRKRR